MPWQASLAGEPINVGFGPVGWTLAYGTRPHVETFILTSERVERIYARAQAQFAAEGTTRQRSDPVGPVSLVIEESETGESVEIAGLYVVEVGPGVDPNTLRVTIADRRWLWPRTLVVRDYNRRRLTGDRRWLRDSLQPIQLGESAPDYAYRRDTLAEGGIPWTASALIADVLTELAGDAWGGTGLLRADGVDVEGVSLLDPGDEAASRVSGLLPGTEFFAGEDGNIAVASAYDGSEADAFRSLTVGREHAGSFAQVRRDLVIPQRFVVQFRQEPELRFDYTESGAVVSLIEGRESRVIENVIPCPVIELSSPDTEESYTLGEWVPVDRFLSCLSDKLVQDGIDHPGIDLAWLRKHYLANWSGATSVLLLSAEESGGVLNEWVAIFGALRTHWRRTFRVLPEWVDKVSSLSLRRSAVIDPENGTRAKATVYTRWLKRLTQLGLNSKFGARKVLQVNDYTADLPSVSQTSPFEVEPVDLSQGVFRLSARVDPVGASEDYVLGSVADFMPNADLRDAKALWAQAELDADWSVAVVISGVQDTPNGRGKLWREDVSVAEAAEALGAPVPSATGPQCELFSGEETARFAWDDQEAGLLDEAFFDGSERPAALLVNSRAVRSLAVAAAARRLSRYLPRVEGRVTVRLTPAEPTGSLSEVRHETSADGSVATTTLTAPPEVPPPSVWALLPEDVRRRIRGLVEE